MKWLKEKRIKDKAYLKWVGTLPCLITGKQDGTVVGHHLMTSGKRGMSLKSPDNYVLPLSHQPHLDVAKGELKYFEAHGIDNYIELSTTLYGLYKNKEYEAAHNLILTKGR